MRIIVTGASGFIGKCFLNTFSDHEVKGTCLSKQKPGLALLDLRDKLSVRAFMSDFRPDIVVHCAARPTVDWCERHPDEAHAINVEPTITLADGCTELGAAMVFLSTDYVFDGLAGPYSETDRTNPINVYGKLKLEAEDEIRSRLDQHIIARTTNVYGFDLESKNFLMGILPRLACGERLQVAVDQIGSPTLVDDLCSTIKKLALDNHAGTFHVAGPDLINRLEWAQVAAQAFELDPNLVVGVETEKLNQPAPRPKRSGLVSEKLSSIITEPLLNLAQGLELMRRQWGGTPAIANW